jgi:hypothetical protein
MREAKGMNNRHFLTRKNLRDLILVLSFGSAVFFDINDAAKCIAFGMLGTGCFIHYVSKGILIRNVVLCTEGIYCVVRHPYYLANFLIDWSFCLLSGNLFLLLSYPFLFYLVYGATIRSEEELLFAQHGNIFIKSILMTPQIFPDINSSRNIKKLFEGFSADRVTGKEYFRITKFIAIGISLGFIHITAGNIILKLNRIRFSPIQGFDEFLLILLVLLLIVFYIAGSIVVRISDQNRDVNQETHPSID